MQKYIRIHDYAYEYQRYVYKVYAEHLHGAYLCTYYNLDLMNSVYDGNILDAASYELIGKKSGLKWRKILYLPVYWIDQVQPSFIADEDGFTKKDQVTNISIPTEYHFQPSPYDFVRFEQEILHPENNPYPLYKVVNFEKSTNTNRTMWRMNLKVSYHTEEQFLENNQISSICVFFDYTKRIYNFDKGVLLYRLLDKNRLLKNINNFYFQNQSLYLM